MNPGQRIKDLREAKNITQTKLAQILGISSALLSGIERGISNPNYEILIEISNFFKVSTDYLLTGKEELTEISADEKEVLEIMRGDNDFKKAVTQAANFKKKAISYLSSYTQAEHHAAV